MHRESQQRKELRPCLSLALPVSTVSDFLQLGIHIMKHGLSSTHLELGLELLHEADARSRVGRDVDARKAKLAGVLRSGKEEVVLRHNITPSHVSFEGDWSLEVTAVRSRSRQHKQNTWRGYVGIHTPQVQHSEENHSSTSTARACTSTSSGKLLRSLQRCTISRKRAAYSQKLRRMNTLQIKTVETD